MFDTGTRVIVLSSSFSGKTGPKKGSIGYVFTEKLGDYGSYYDSGQRWFVMLHRVVFVRYGFEDKQRNETKFFINIFPYVSDKEAVEIDTAELVNRKLDLVEKFDPTGERIYDRVKYSVTSKFGKKHVHVGILAPIPANTSLIETSPNDFAAWVECFMKDDNFHRVVMTMINNFGRLTNIIAGDYITMIKKMIDSREERAVRLKLAQGTPAMREGIVTTIRKIIAIGDRPKRRERRRSQRKWLSNNRIYGSTSRQLTGMRMVFHRLYSRDAIENLKIIHKRNEGAKEIENKVKYVLETIAQMVSRARALEDGMEAKAQTVNHK